MFRTFAIAAADMMDPVKRAEWDATLSKFEADVEMARCAIVMGGTTTENGVLVASFHVKKNGHQAAQTPHGIVQVPAKGVDFISGADFEAALKTGLRNVSKDPGVSGPRILGG